jgi:hypothetical protein
VWNSILVTLIQYQSYGDMRVIQEPGGGGGGGPPGQKGQRGDKRKVLYKKKYFLPSSNFKLFKQKKIRQKIAVVKDLNFCQGWLQ